MPRKKLPPLEAGYERVVVKIQRPLYATEAAPQVLVHNEDKTLVTYLPYDQAMFELIGNDFKQYWLADMPMKVKGHIKLHKQMPEQEW